MQRTSLPFACTHNSKVFTRDRTVHRIKFKFHSSYVVIRHCNVHVYPGFCHFKKHSVHLILKCPPRLNLLIYWSQWYTNSQGLLWSKNDTQCCLQWSLIYYLLPTVNCTKVDYLCEVSTWLAYPARESQQQQVPIGKHPTTSAVLLLLLLCSAGKNLVSCCSSLSAVAAVCVLLDKFPVSLLCCSVKG